MKITKVEKFLAKSGSCKSLVIFLHGYGADGSDLISLSDYFSEVMPNAQFISPDAPFSCAMSAFGKEWFPIEKMKCILFTSFC